MWNVSYLTITNGITYRVSRRFDTREEAQEYIDNNALIHPLPGVLLEKDDFKHRPFRR